MATVSRVVNEAGSVSSKTRSKVLSAISTLEYRPDVHAVELGRAKRDIQGFRGISRLSSARPATESHSVPRAETQKECRKTGRLRLLEEENARLRRLVTNLSMDVEMWRRIAQ